jgi:hypothetical protein
MPDALVLDMPVELSLEIMAVVGSYLANAERELFDDVVNEVDRIGLGVLVVDLEGAYARCVVNSGVLKVAHRPAAFPFERQELNVNLDMVARNLLIAAFRVHFAHPGTSGEPVETIAPENAVNPGIRDFDVVVARQIPNDPDWPQMILAAQIKNLFHDLGRRLVRRVLRDRLGIDQTSVALLTISFAPSIETGLSNPKVPACLAGVADLLGILTDS